MWPSCEKAHPTSEHAPVGAVAGPLYRVAETDPAKTPLPEWSMVSRSSAANIPNEILLSVDPGPFQAKLMYPVFNGEKPWPMKKPTCVPAAVFGSRMVIGELNPLTDAGSFTVKLGVVREGA